MAAGIVVLMPVTGEVLDPVFGTGNDAAAVILPDSAPRLAVWAATRTRHDAVLLAPPEGYAHLYRSRTGAASSGVAGVDRSLFLAVKNLSGLSEDPGPPEVGSPAGTAKMNMLWIFG
jgi:hypothetical protein